MDTLVHADIFFFVTTIAVVVVAVAFAMMSFYIVGILRRVRDIADDVKKETVLFREDINDARMRVKAGGLRLAHLFDFLWGGESRTKKSKTQRK